MMPQNNMVGIGTTTPSQTDILIALVIKAGASASDGAGLSIEICLGRNMV